MWKEPAVARRDAFARLMQSHVLVLVGVTNSASIGACVRASSARCDAFVWLMRSHVLMLGVTTNMASNHVCEKGQQWSEAVHLILLV